MLYFLEFVDLVKGPWMASTSNRDFWGVMLPQLVRNNTTLHHAATAIGAMSVWHRQFKDEAFRARPVLLQIGSPTAEQDPHHYNAIAYYCYSLKSMRQHASVQDAILLSLLLLCFETLRGNRKAALDHLNHGLTILLWLTTERGAQNHIASLGPDPMPIFKAVATIFIHLAPQARMVLRGKVSHEMPLPNFSKTLTDNKHSMESFMVLLSQLCGSSMPPDHVPAVFNNLDKFEECLMAIQRRQNSLGPIMLQVIRDTGVLDSKDQSIINDFHHRALGDPSIRDFCDNSKRLLQDLDAAFLPLFNKIILSDPSSPEYLRAILLRLQLLAVYVLDYPPQYLDFDLLQARTPDFREFLSLAEIALRTAKQAVKNPAHQLSLQCELAGHLLRVALVCRDPLARDQAMWMLRDYPGRDGRWNAPSLYAMALRNRDVERETAAEGTPTEQWQRLWHREHIFEDGGDRVIFRYIEKNAATGIWQMVEEAADVLVEFENGSHWVRQPLTGSGKLLMREWFPLESSPENGHHPGD